jgi:hypothetical protein
MEADIFKNFTHGDASPVGKNALVRHHYPQYTREGFKGKEILPIA